MTDRLRPPHHASALVAVKIAHTVAWAFFAGCIVAIPLASWRGNQTLVAWLIGIVFVEVAILLINGACVRWHSP